MYSVAYIIIYNLASLCEKKWNHIISPGNNRNIEMDKKMLIKKYVASGFYIFRHIHTRIRNMFDIKFSTKSLTANI